VRLTDRVAYTHHCTRGLSIAYVILLQTWTVGYECQRRIKHMFKNVCLKHNWCTELKTSLAAMKMDEASITKAKLYLVQQVDHLTVGWEIITPAQ